MKIAAFFALCVVFGVALWASFKVIEPVPDWHNGELVVIFPEGGISRTGHLQAFRPGLLKIQERTDAPIVPVYLDGLWGSIFSFSEGRFFWKRPRQWPFPIDVHFGTPLAAPDDIHHVRNAVLALGSRAVATRIRNAMQLTRSFVRRCKSRKWKSKVADSLGTDLTGGQTLLRALLLRRLLQLGPGTDIDPDPQLVHDARDVLPPKEVCSLMAWIFYAILLHERLTVGWRGRRAALLSVFGFLILVLAFVGANLWLSDYHSFKNMGGQPGG